MLLWTVYQPNRELSHLVVLPKSTSEFVADALTCPHVDSRAGVTKNLPLFKLASVLVPLDHVSSCMLFQENEASCENGNFDSIASKIRFR